MGCVVSNEMDSYSAQYVAAPTVAYTKCSTLYDAGAESSATNSDVAFSKMNVHGDIPVPENPMSSVVAHDVRVVNCPAPKLQMPA